MNSNLSEKILKDIKNKKLKPAAKWEFLAKEYAIWISFVISLCLGALAVALTFFLLSTSDLGLAKYMQNSSLQFYASHIPVLWILTFVIFVLLAEYTFKHTKSGYKFTLSQVIIANLVISLVFGSILHFAGLAKKIDKVAVERIPMYQQFGVKRQQDFWTQGEKGFLAGEITQVIDKEHIEILDFQGETWQVNFSEEIILPPKLPVGDRVKLLGEIQAENNFLATQLRPWEPNLNLPKRIQASSRR